jgi:hypothetical protein
MDMKLSNLDLELILSGKTAKLLRIKPTERANLDPAHFLASWRVELARDGSRGGYFDDLVQQFLMRLRFTLLEAQPPIEWKPDSNCSIRPVRGGSASLIGTMNNMVYLLEADRSSQQIHSEEQILNDTPFFAIPEIFPNKAFFARLNQK